MARIPPDAPKLAKDLGFALAGLKIAFAAGTSSHGTIVLSGTIKAGGLKVGWSTREINEASGSREVHSRGIWLQDSAYQGLGFGKAFEKHSELVFSAYGVERIFLLAKEIGAYAWSRCGYSLAGGEPVQQRASYGIWSKGGRERALASVKPGQTTQEAFDELDEKFRGVQAGSLTPLHPYEISEAGRSETWQEGSRSMWLGKRVLIDSKWSGVKLLK